jgi:hypothetical protein
MTKLMEVLLTVVVLAGLYSAISVTTSQPGNATVQMQQTVVVADGSDPMPLCRKKNCGQ